MPYHRSNNIIIKSILVGLLFLVLDLIAHSTIGNNETFYYFLAKPFIFGYFAFLFFRFRGNINRFVGVKSNNIIISLGLFGTFAALVHGLYYRGVELFTNMPFFSRVGDINLGIIIFNSDSIIQGILGWWLVHGGSFILVLLLIDELF